MSRGGPKRGGGPRRGGSGRGAPGGRGPGGSGRGTPKGRGGPSRPPARPPRDRAGTDEGRPAGTGSARRGLGGEQVEGRQAVRELLLAGSRRVREVLVAADLDRSPIVDEILQLAEDDRVPVHRVTRARLDGAARTDAPQGVVAHADPLVEHDVDDLATGAVRATASGDGPPFLLALDGLTDPGNLGAVLRSASAAGVTGVVLPRHRAVHVTPTVAKAAAGAIEHLPMAVVGGLPAALARLRDQGVWSVGLDADAHRSLWDLEAADVPLVLVLGAEGSGLSRLVRQRCDQVVSIPMAGPLDSLNAATAGALACFEVARHRGATAPD
ncbi:23S rRNA (guanosine(2251)-2'-O)-methyltransferase RlmB [Iamia sp. SCSIO 61187]|uniref:23S rRNA (guanosine(2251)-2'-O)-methyltransferase RlmB n=1 Tax=Iamia sp. SCSIO 61187 TaxID=2722752 RepID=UPI001C630942|nr:23S rRNA (guanosine(2251)-2'-O)-methyltransferase RlmB [Iamia sp. SCSIO 61187]QYG91641.1 23S rRNA (guanosine(2251)-2'-O)-methyltransferase RlmB [Iamia sp. SCSIO 61187]